MEIVPEKKCNCLVFFPVPEFDDLDLAFGAAEKDYFNRYDLPDIPHEYEKMARNLFFNGGELPKLHPSVDRKKAIRAINAWLGSFAPAHEAKEATVGYALWLWTHETALN